jgi:hypothetical protein
MNKIWPVCCGISRVGSTRLHDTFIGDMWFLPAVCNASVHHFVEEVLASGSKISHVAGLFCLATAELALYLGDLLVYVIE